VTYQGVLNSTASRTLTTAVSDGSLSASATSTITITPVNDAPTVLAPAAFAFTEDIAGNLTYTGTPFADIDNTSVTVTLSVTDGIITGNAATGITVGGTATARTFSGAVSDLNTYFTTAGKITYQGAQDNTANRTLTTTVSDGALLASATSTMSFTAVNDAPRFTGVLFGESFDAIIGVSDGVQLNNSHPLQAGATLANWTRTGTNAFHSVGRGVAGGTDLALMIWFNNVAATTTAIAANVSGVTYTVAFELAPAVYKFASEQTTSVDRFRVQIVNQSSTVLQDYQVAAGPYAASNHCLSKTW
jgi:hypothetical protein